MAGQKTTIILNDYNSIQAKLASVMGVGAGDYGYGQFISSSQIAGKTLISSNIWNNLRNDLLRARQHQTGVDESSNIPLAVKGTVMTDADRATFNTVADTIISNRLVTPPISQATRENLDVLTRTTPWNSTLTHQVTLAFQDVNSARYYFNSGSLIEFSASRTGGTSGTKNSSWTTLLTNMGKISFGINTTTKTGSGTANSIGYSSLTTSDQLIFQKLTETPLYSPNQYDIYAKLGSSAATIIFTINFSDLSTGSYDENVDGTLVSTVQTYRATGSNVSVALPNSAPVVPTYSISSDAGSIGEGLSQLGYFTVTTTNIPNGTTLYWTTSGTGITASDFTDNTLSGSVVINNNTGSFRRIATADNLTEGAEYFRIQLRTGSITGPVQVESAQVSILDLSTAPSPISCSLTQSDTIISEGGSAVTFTVTTSGVTDGTVLYWTTVVNTGITASDFTDNTLSGSITINNNSATFTRTAYADRVTEGSEALGIQIRTGSITGPVVASTTGGVLILDTSQNPAYSLSASPTYINETTSNTSTITLSLTNYVIGSTLYYTWGGTATYGTDFTVITGTGLSSTSGSFTVTGATMVWTIQTTDDHTTEGSETIFLQIRETSVSSPVVAQSPTITVNDTSLSPSYSLSLDKTTVNETTSNSFTLTLTTTNMISGTILYMSYGGTAVRNTDYQYISGPSINGSTGAFTVNSGVMSWTWQTVADNLTEGPETVSFTVHSGSNTGTTVATSNLVTITDTSINIPTGSISVSPSPTINEGNSITITFTNTDFPLGTILYAKGVYASGTDSTDFYWLSGQAIATNGGFPVTGSVMTWVTGVVADKLTEGPESIYWEVHTGSQTGPLLCTSNTITINDTSTTQHGTSSYSNAGTYSFTVPNGITTVNYTIVAGGGSGGSAHEVGNGGGGGGGGSGGHTTGNATVTPGEIISIIVGAGGSPSTAAGRGQVSAGNSGGLSRITTSSGTISTTGGGAGGGGDNSVGGAGGTAGSPNGIAGTAGSPGTSDTSSPAGGAGGTGYNGYGAGSSGASAIDRTSPLYWNSVSGGTGFVSITY